MKRIKGVLEDAERQRAEFKESGAWLHDSVPFNQDRYLDDKNKALANQLFNFLHLEGGYKTEQRRKDFEILLANLFDQTIKPISISLNKNDWKSTRYNNSSYTTIKELLSILHKKKYIDMKEGYYFVEGSRMTRISATERLLEYFPEYPTGVLSKPKELVILRDEKGKLKEYTDTRETWRIRAILSLVNEVNSKADIMYLQYKLQGALVAIFNERFTWYGRLHTKGFRHYQGFNEEERSEITINGNSVVEKDYSGLHPFLLYAEEGIQYSADPYSIIDKRPEVRPFLKIILLSMLNAKDEVSAEKAANYWLFQNNIEREQLLTLGVSRAKPFIDKFLEVHEKISHHFCKGKDTGMKIMNKDSKIALDVLNYFAKKNIPILCVHDSFIVQNQYQDELIQVMRDMYKKHTGFRIKIG